MHPTDDNVITQDDVIYLRMYRFWNSLDYVNSLRFLKRFLVVQNLKIAESSVFIFSYSFSRSFFLEKLRENEYATFSNF